VSDQNKPLHLLFVCSRNQWRSPTAENLWKNHGAYQARSAGTSAKAKRTVSPEDIRWADQIFVMEKNHRSRLKAQFTEMLEGKTIHVLDIPDEYQYMDQDLVDELQDKVSAILEHPGC